MPNLSNPSAAALAIMIAAAAGFTIPDLEAATPTKHDTNGSGRESVPAPELPIVAQAFPSALDLLAVSDTPTAVDGRGAEGNATGARSQNVTINLINRLVQKGILAKEDATELIKQAEADAAVAKAQATAAAMEAVQAAQAADAPPASDDAVRVTYIPETVKAQIRDQIKQEVMSQAKNENWAAPRALPSWVSKVRLSGDMRIRGEGIFFPSGNDNEGAFPNFNAINTGAPFDTGITSTIFSPQLNVDQDRQRIRIRARLALEADIANGFTMGFRIATGETNTPTSTNQSLGVANNAQGGNFSKYAIWLDRGFLKYEYGSQLSSNLTLLAGRFDNPFFTASEIMWDEDVGLDGFAAQVKYEVAPGVTPFVTGGAFPVFNTDLNFASNRPDKFESQDKWLYAVQGGINWKITPKVTAKVAAGYYDFKDVEGRLSKPFVPLNASDAGDTDGTRPAFAQKGNTYRPLRDIIPTVDNDFGTTRQFQYYGLATPFRVLSLTGRVDMNFFEPIQISLLGEYDKNTAFDQAAINRIAVNNRGPSGGTGALGSYEGGDTAWFVGLRVGKGAMEKAWDWNVGFNYRHVESDAVVDGFTDSDFGLGGTNLEGYSISGSLSVAPNVWFNVRWMSANELAGPQQKTDVLLIDLNGRF